MQLLRRSSVRLSLWGSAVAALAVALILGHQFTGLLGLVIGISIGSAELLIFRAFRRTSVVQSTRLTLQACIELLEHRDIDTADHSVRVSYYALLIGKKLGMNRRQLERLYWTSRLHDIGKLTIDDAILKKPGPLNAREWGVVKSHPSVSARILRSFHHEGLEAEIVRCHHERFDGTGYYNRDASQVPIESFVIAVADSFDALTNDRPYRKAFSVEAALHEICQHVGSQFHPRVAAAFFEAMDYVDPPMEQTEILAA